MLIVYHDRPNPVTRPAPNGKSTKLWLFLVCATKESAAEATTKTAITSICSPSTQFVIGYVGRHVSIPVWSLLQAFLEFCYGPMYSLIMALATCIICIIYFSLFVNYCLYRCHHCLFVTVGMSENVLRRRALLIQRATPAAPPIIGQHGAVIQPAALMVSLGSHFSLVF